MLDTKLWPQLTRVPEVFTYVMAWDINGHINLPGIHITDKAYVMRIQKKNYLVQFQKQKIQSDI